MSERTTRRRAHLDRSSHSRPHLRTVAVGLALGATTLAFIECKGTKTQSGTEPISRAEATASATASAFVGSPRLPPEPPPRIADASGLPKVKAILLADAAYQSVLKGTDSKLRKLFLTAISQTLVTENGENPNSSVPEDTDLALKKKNLEDAFSVVSAFFARTGTYPTEVMTALNDAITTGSAQPELGVWVPKGSTPRIDFSALAAWARPEDPKYLREVIRAKTNGPIGWETVKSPTRPYLVRERAALERLSLLTALTPEEQSRLAQLRASPLGDEPPDQIELGNLLSEYGSNEVRADDKFKGKVIQFTGVAGEIQRSEIGGITIRVGTGKGFENPQALCFFRDSQGKSVSALSKGDRVTFKGRVDKLMMAVLVKDCEVVQ